MHPYSFNSIQINGRAVAIEAILNGAISNSDFESDTFNFIKEWLSGQTEFSIPTSGSTGKPKVILITRDQMIASAEMTINALSLKKEDSALICLNTKFIAGKMMLVRALIGDLKIISMEPSSNPFQKVLSEKIDFAALVPLQLQTILESAQAPSQLNTMKAVLVGGGTVNDKLKSIIIKKVTAPVYQTYGMTETITHIALQLLNTKNKSNSYQTLPGIKIKTDDRGCLIISVPYFDHEIITNDLVSIESSNCFKWLGRWDNVINTGGLKVIPENLELEMDNIFSSLNMKINFFVFGVPDHRLGNKIMLALEGEFELDDFELDKILRSKLSRFEIPKSIIRLPNFTYTENGKINRKATIESLKIKNLL